MTIHKRKKRPPLPQLLVAFFWAPPSFTKLAPCWQVDDTLTLPATDAEIRNWKAALGKPFPHRHRYVVVTMTPNPQEAWR